LGEKELISFSTFLLRC